MKKFTINKTIEIKAPKEKVWEVLLTPKHFTEWAKEFCPDSEMKADWKMGGTVFYTDDQGRGLKGTVVEFKPNEIVTVKYDNAMDAFKEAPGHEESEKWRGCKETYKLSEKNKATHFSLASEVPTKEFYDMLDQAWDKSLLIIKRLAEKNDQEIKKTFS
jgi:uncharacterized protein YndB with AHSA1/START domain